VLAGEGWGADADENLSPPGGFDQPIRALHHIFERLRGRQARKHDVRLRAHLGRRAAGNAADFLELGERAAAVAHHAIAALDQVFGNRQSDLADTDEADRFHALTLPYGVIRGLDPRIHLLTKTDGCRVISAFTRVFNALCPAMTIKPIVPHIQPFPTPARATGRKNSP